MTDAEILDHWRKAEHAYLRATHNERPEATKIEAEKAASEQFGMESYLQAFRDRFGEPPRA